MNIQHMLVVIRPHNEGAAAPPSNVPRQHSKPTFPHARLSPCFICTTTFRRCAWRVST